MVYLIRRFFAYYIDATLISVIYFIVFIFINVHIYGSLSKIPNLTMTLSSYFVFISIVLFYFCIFDILKIQTLGKKILKLKIKGYENTNFKSRLMKTVIRNISRLIPFEPFSILIDEKYLTWHDKLSKTEVVDCRKK